MHPSPIQNLSLRSVLICNIAHSKTRQKNQIAPNAQETLQIAKETSKTLMKYTRIETLRNPMHAMTFSTQRKSAQRQEIEPPIPLQPTYIPHQRALPPTKEINFYYSRLCRSLLKDSVVDEDARILILRESLIDRDRKCRPNDELLHRSSIGRKTSIKAKIVRDHTGDICNY